MAVYGAANGRGRMSWRHLWNLTRYLPTDAATWVERDGAQALWTLDHEFAATLIEVVHAQTRVLIKLLAKKGSGTGEKLRIPRPYQLDAGGEEAERVTRLASAEDIAEWMGLETTAAIPEPEEV